MSRDRLLVIDSCIGKALAARLRDRGRNAIATSAIGLATGVEAAEHGDVIREAAATIATVHPDRPEGVAEYEWMTDVIHRQAHLMQEQPPQSVRRYSFAGSRVWTPRRRHVRLIRERGWTPWSPEA